jgi:F-type H+-transporting ATPase subunit a
MHELPIYTLFGVKFDLSSIIMITVTVAIVLLLAILATRKLSLTNPSKLQNLMEWVVEFIHGLISSTMDMKKGQKFVMLGITLIMFIFVANMLGLPFAIVTEHDRPMESIGITQEVLNKYAEKNPDHPYPHVLWWKSPTADVSVTMGLAILIIFMAHYLGLSRNRKHYLHHYIEPHPLFFPLNLIKEVSKLLTLGLRLFGNIYAGEVLIGVILLAGVFGILPLIAWQGFSIFVGAIQAFVFTILTMVYISQNIEHKN